MKTGKMRAVECTRYGPRYFHSKLGHSASLSYSNSVPTPGAFGINALLSTQPDTDLFNRKTVAAYLGKDYSTLWQSFPQPHMTLAHLRTQGYKIITTSPFGSVPQAMVELSTEPIELVIGNETKGVIKECMQQADIVIQIRRHLHLVICSSIKASSPARTQTQQNCARMLSQEEA